MERKWVEKRANRKISKIFGGDDFENKLRVFQKM